MILCVRSNFLSIFLSTLERKIKSGQDDQIVGSFGKLRRDEKKRKERKDVRIAADLSSDEADV